MGKLSLVCDELALPHSSARTSRSIIMIIMMCYLVEAYQVA